MLPDNSDGSVFKKFFEETNVYYQESKAYILLIEKYQDKLVLTPINELRNAVYHLYEMIQQPQHNEKNFIEAKEHVIRACYDTFSILAAYYISRIGQVDKTYGVEVVREIYPDYYSKIRPEMSTLIEEIAQIRSLRESQDPIAEKVPTNRVQVIATLSKWSKTLESLTNDFARLKASKRRKSILEKILIPFIFLIFGGIISWFIKTYC